MLEAKAKDLSLLKLRPDLLRYAPDVAARFGLSAADAAAMAAEEAGLESDGDREEGPAEEPWVPGRREAAAS
jgi:UV DNA damage endonuclease